jgi:hypothetical protein
MITTNANSPAGFSPLDDHFNELTYSAAPDVRGPEIGQGPTLSIVGGGFCGTIALVHLLNTLVELESLGAAPSHLEINWFDQAGHFGRGLPYRSQTEQADNGTLILNQPAALMSPFADKPDAYTDWLARRHPQYGADSFTPRSLFGAFIEETLDAAERAAAHAGCRFAINRRVAQVSNLESSGELYLEADGELIRGGPLVLASGHQRRDQFGKFAGLPGYIDQPFEVDRYRSIDLSATSNVILIGGGPSSIDAIRILESLGYRGSYQIIANQITRPWPFDTALYSAESFGRFVPQYFRPELIPENPSYRDLTRLLRREVTNAQERGFGEGHVYYGIDISGIAAKLAASSDQEGAREFGKYLSFLRGNITAPENVDLLAGITGEKRLRYLKGRAVQDLSAHDDSVGEFRIVVQHRSGKLPSGKAEVLVNCSLFPRGVAPHALLAAAKMVGVIDSIFPVGPALPSDGVIPRSWGVESFRKEVEDAAKKALRKALELA